MLLFTVLLNPVQGTSQKITVFFNTEGCQQKQITSLKIYVTPYFVQVD